VGEAVDEIGLPKVDIASERWGGDLSGRQCLAGKIKSEKHGLVFEWEAGSDEQAEHRHSAGRVLQNH
jgi:hypothetical protein